MSSLKTPSRQSVLPTPPLPNDLPLVDLTDNARQALVRRYVRRGDNGKPAESIEEMFWRVAYHVARVEETWDGDVIALAREYYHLLTSKSFFPNSPTFTGEILSAGAGRSSIGRSSANEWLPQQLQAIVAAKASRHRKAFQAFMRNS